MTGPPDQDQLRAIGRAAIAKIQSSQTTQFQSAKIAHLAAVEARKQFAAAAWVAGASYQQIGDMLRVKRQTILRLVADLIPADVRNDLAAERHTGRALVSYNRVLLMKQIYDEHANDVPPLSIAQLAELFVRIDASEEDE